MFQFIAVSAVEIINWEKDCRSSNSANVFCDDELTNLILRVEAHSSLEQSYERAHSFSNNVLAPFLRPMCNKNSCNGEKLHELTLLLH